MPRALSLFVLWIEFYRKRLRAHSSDAVGLAVTFDPVAGSSAAAAAVYLSACVSPAGCGTFCVSAIYRALLHTGCDRMVLVMMRRRMFDDDDDDDGLLTDSLSHTHSLLTAAHLIASSFVLFPLRRVNEVDSAKT